MRLQGDGNSRMLLVAGIVLVILVLAVLAYFFFLRG
jgi:hypothetical protein